MFQHKGMWAWTCQQRIVVNTCTHTRIFKRLPNACRPEIIPDDFPALNYEEVRGVKTSSSAINLRRSSRTKGGVAGRDQRPSLCEQSPRSIGYTYCSHISLFDHLPVGWKAPLSRRSKPGRSESVSGSQDDWANQESWRRKGRELQPCRCGIQWEIFLL